ncbi:hypothetical protein vBAbaMD22_141 [Acinetobacter phage vB_AbaM_D22]|nr:hypothetical protein vBAbaMD22_141 [Acinetobacter phage vB_AbaM_D22]
MMYALVLLVFGNNVYTPIEKVEIKHSLNYSQCKKQMNDLNKNIQGAQVQFTCDSYRLR